MNFQISKKGWLLFRVVTIGLFGALSVRVSADCSASSMKTVVPTGEKSIDVTFPAPKNVNWLDTVVRKKPAGGEKAEVPGVLIPPSGAKGPYPVVILISGSFSYNHANSKYVSELSSRGIGAFVFDPFCPRGLSSLRGGRQDALPSTTIMSDAFKALKMLAGRKDIDGKNIGLAGWSIGGTITNLAADREIQKNLGDDDVTFKAGVSIYGSCIQHLANKTPSDMHLLALIGKRDDWAGAQQCNKVLAEMKKKGFDVQTREFDAAHAWDSGTSKTTLGSELSFGECNMVIDSKAAIIEQKTGKRIMSGADFLETVKTCGHQGATIEGNSSATKEGLKEFGDFFSKHLLDSKSQTKSGTGRI